MTNQDILIAIVLSIYVIGGATFNILSHLESKKNDNEQLNKDKNDKE